MTEGPIAETCEAWRKKARNACDTLLRKYTETRVAPEPRQTVWAELKQLFLETVFSGRCAYCEAKLPTANFSAHVEHYRPKGAVTVNQEKIEHPGYFWLAYEWHNLLLVCEKCNTWHSERIGEEKRSYPGKSTEFPIQGTRVMTPSGDSERWREQLKEERPLLLSPYEDEPEKHIGFTEAGVPYAINKCPRGAATITICHLDRLELCADRLKYAEEESERRLVRAIVKRRPVETGDMDFSLWMRFALNAAIEGLRPG